LAASRIRQQVPGGLVGGAVLFEDSAAGDGQGVVDAFSVEVVARRGGGEGRRCSLTVNEKPWGAKSWLRAPGSCQANGGGAAGAPSART
jgi:hypothetical protein